MKDFAKLYQTERGQILVLRHDSDTNGKPEVRFFFDPNHPVLGVCSLALGFPDSDAGENAADKAFEDIDKARAENLVFSKIDEIHAWWQKRTTCAPSPPPRRSRARRSEAERMPLPVINALEAAGAKIPPKDQPSEADVERVREAVKRALGEIGFMDPEWRGSDADADKVARAALAAMRPTLEPTEEMVTAALNSKARDDEGEFQSLSDLLDFSGENKARSVAREAIRAALAAMGRV